MRFNGTFPVSGRDFITAGSTVKKEDGTLVISTISIPERDFRYPSAKKTVRGLIIYSGIMLTPLGTNKTKYLSVN